MINLEKFDELNKKLLNKLNEEYSDLSEVYNGDLFNSDSSNRETENFKKAENQASKVYNDLKNLKNAGVRPEIIKAVDAKRDKAIIDKKEASTKITKARQLKKMQKNSLNEDFDISLISDEEVFSLAEEFEHDLNEDITIQNIKQTLEKRKNEEIDKTKKKINEEKNKKSSELEDLKSKSTEDKNNMNNQMQQNEFNITNDADKNIKSISSSSENKIKTIDRQLNKLDNIEKEQREKKSLDEGIIHNVKSMIVNKKFDKIAKKKEKLVLKLSQLDAEKKKAESKNNLAKSDRIQNQMNKIQSKLDAVEKKYRKQNDKLVALGEDAEFLNSLDTLCEEIDVLLEEIENDKTLLEDDGLSNNSIYQKNKYLLEAEYQEPMAKKLVKTINEELLKENDCDNIRVNVLLSKLKQYKG